MDLNSKELDLFRIENMWDLFSRMMSEARTTKDNDEMRAKIEKTSLKVLDIISQELTTRHTIDSDTGNTLDNAESVKIEMNKKADPADTSGYFSKSNHLEDLKRKLAGIKETENKGVLF